MATNNPRVSPRSVLARCGLMMLLAAGLLGCGVGVDELGDGSAVGTQTQALLPGETPAPGTPGFEPTSAPPPSNPRDPGLVALPQDPVPFFEGKPRPNQNTRYDAKPVTPKR